MSEKLYYLRQSSANRYYISSITSEGSISHDLEAHKMKLLTKTTLMLLYGKGLLKGYEVFEVELGNEVEINIELTLKSDRKEETPDENQGEVVIRD